MRSTRQSSQCMKEAAPIDYTMIVELPPGESRIVKFNIHRAMTL